MARIRYAEGTSSFRRLLNHSPEVAKAYWGLRDALNAGVVPAKLRLLGFLATDITNHCRY